MGDFFPIALTLCGHLQTEVAAEISLVLDTTPNSWKIMFFV